MTRPRNWWVEEENGKWYLYRTPPDSSEGSREPETPITDVEVYSLEDKGAPDCVKVHFASGRPKAVQWRSFLWNKTPTCSSLKNTKGIISFVDKLKGFIDRGSLSRASVTGEDSETQLDVFTFQDDPQRREESEERTNTKRKAGDVPALHRAKRVDRKESPSSELDAIKQSVYAAFLGIARIDVENLEVGGLQLREVNHKFLTGLTEAMLEFSDHSYQPLIVLTKSQENTDNFSEAAANGFHYRAIGGIHNLLACKQLQKDHPTREVFSSRLCLVYSYDLSMETQLWLANKHNRIGETRHRLSCKEKIQLCRDRFEQRAEGDVRKWTKTCGLILNDESERTVKIYTDLASRVEGEYNFLIRALDMSRDGQLRGQKLKDGVFSDIAPYQMRYLANLPVEAYNQLLQELIDGEITMGSLKKESHLLMKLLAVQRKFLQILNIPSWEEATELYPLETTRDMLLPFTRKALDKTLPALRDYCNLLRNTRDNPGCTAALQIARARGFLVDSDARVFNFRQDEIPAEFRGFSLIVMNYPKDWNAEDISLFVNKAVSLNLNKGRRDFTLAVLCSLQSSEEIRREVRLTGHFSKITTAFFYDANSAPTDDILTPCLHGVVLAIRGDHHKKLRWEDGSHLNVIPVRTEREFTNEDGTVKDRNYVSAELYENLVAALTGQGEWVLDACCGSGCGFFATVKKGRNCIGMDDSPFIRMAKVRVASEKANHQDRKETSDKGGDDDTVEDDTVDTVEDDTVEDYSQEDDTMEDAESEA